MEIASLIEEAKRVYAAVGLDCGHGLMPPASEAAIDVITQELGLPVPPELREVYRVHGGQEEVGAGVTGLFGWHRLLTPRQGIENHQLYCDTCVQDPTTFPPAPGAWASWVPELIPFASFNDYDLCVHAASGDVWEFRPGSGLIRHRPSIAAVLREVIAAVRAGREPQVD
jgi:hypothetical protein